MANCYAEIVVALWRDRQRLGLVTDEPIYLCELGAGSGRFAFHFLQRLTHLCQQAAIPLTDFCYVLTDVAQQNLDYLGQHPRFQPFFANGLLDLAFFDINHSDLLQLQQRQYTITPDTLTQPLVVIANYLFDSIPQELFYLEDGQIAQCLVSLLADTNPDALDKTELLGHVHCEYEYERLTETPYPEEPYLAQLITEYQQTLSDTHLLFPVAGLRGLQRLQALSQSGLVLLSADKGTHRLADLQNRPAPQLVAHTGCFSLNVNYHALKRLCEQKDGIALFPSQQHNHVNIGCLLFLKEVEAYKQTCGAYARHVAEFGPDAFYSITKHARQDMAAMSARDILAYMQLSFDDAHLFACYLPRLVELVSEFSRHEWETVRAMVDRIWKNYFPIGEEHNLAEDIARLFYEISDYERVLTYLSYSMELYGKQVGTLLNMALCHLQLENHDQAVALWREVLSVDPDNRLAKQLLAQYEPTSPDFMLLPNYLPGKTIPLLKQPIKRISPTATLRKTAVPPDLVLRSGVYE
ncbi:MAG: tetratricopeptide repeat protein [Chloroflexi bacterium]|nr:tetratricopeptide repeat protein [Chloroflexota bacterium]